MSLTKQPISINFAKGIETKTDPFQLSVGQFLSLQNSVFTTGEQLRKRNGFAALATLPDTSSTFLTTFNGDLTAIGTKFEAYAAGSKSWINKGFIQPLTLSTLSLVRSNTNQSQTDSVVAPNGFVCTVFTDDLPSGVSHKYVVADSVTGQNIIPPTVIPVSSGATNGTSRVFLLGNYFVIVFTNIIGGTDHLQYIAVSISNPTIVTANTDISAQYTRHNTVAFDGVVANNALYLAWNGSDVGGAIRMTFIDATLFQHNTIVAAGATHIATTISVCADVTGNNPNIYVSFYNQASGVGFTLSTDQILNIVLTPQVIISTANTTIINNIATAAHNGVVSIFYEVNTVYIYDTAIQTNVIEFLTVTNTAVVSSTVILARSVGLASKAFIVNGVIYFMGVYSSPNQPTYFLFDASARIIAKLAYSNAGGYNVRGIPSVTVSGSTAFVSYLFKDIVQAVNKTQNPANANGIYSQTGINLAAFTIGTSNIASSEIALNLNLTGGFVWAYDGYQAVEQGFFVWPDYVEASWLASGGSIAAQPDGVTNTNAYFYQATYEWSDNQGNIYRSAPSIPIPVTTTGSGTSGSITVNIPTLRLTYKTSNPVKIVLYRWSVAQQIYYQVTSIVVPVLNDLTVDYVTIVDTFADSQIIGNNIIYTTGGVIENISPPSSIDNTLFKSRFFLIDSEDDNLLWYSKQVIQSVPVEMSDLFTLYVAPTTDAQGSTGGMKCLAPMDDKLIIFKKDAIYYLTGNGPDNTGANNDFSEPVFITSTVGCANKRSIVFMPQGLMFQSDKGIWLLGRDLSTTYIGASVEAYNSQTVNSAVNIPGQNQVRFMLSGGVTLMYDYFYNQWGTFTGIPAISSTLYQSSHTYLDKYGRVFQETPGTYLDGSNPVLMGLTTGWLNLAGLQGYQRAYYLYLLGTYITPHKLIVQIGYDYNQAGSQQTIITPTNFNLPYGGDTPYGAGSPYGGNPTLEQWRIHLIRQRCQAFQVSIQEVYDSTLGVAAGAGLTLSGMNCVVALKKGFYPIRGAQSAG